MVVFTFEAQVALHVDIDLGQGSVQVLSDLVDVFLNEEKLPVGFCETALIFFNLRYGEFRYGDSCNIKAGNQKNVARMLEQTTEKKPIPISVECLLDEMRLPFPDDF